MSLKPWNIKRAGEKVTLDSFFSLGEYVDGVRYEYLTEDFRNKEVTIKEILPCSDIDTAWYKIEEMPFAISHGMIR